MKIGLKYIFTSMMVVLALSWSGCSDPGAVADQNAAITNGNWTYTNKIKFDVKIDDADVAYNLYLNLRVTADYKYSNMFVLIHQVNPDKKSAGTRYEVKLANPDGEWLGTGSGNLYSYQTPFKINYKFPAKGTYTFIIEQNMRDNPLKEVSDVGIRVAKVQR